MTSSVRNYLLLELGDNDFSTHLKETLDIIEANFDLQSVTEETVKTFVIQHMVGLDICYKSFHATDVDWENAKKTSEYLSSKLKVSFQQQIDYSVDYDSGAACLDVRLGMVSILRHALY